MALKDLVLSLMVFPQMWDRTNLSLNVLLLPAADPTKNLTQNGPKFAGTSYALQAVLIPSLENPPVDNDPQARVFSLPAAATAVPSTAVPLFNKLAQGRNVVARPPKPLAADLRIWKALPESYTTAFAFEQPRKPFFAVGEAFGCAIRAQDPGKDRTPPTRDVTWGQLISFALRQPKLAGALGLVYGLIAPLTIAPDPADVQNGGWLFIRFDPARNPYAADLALNPDLIKLYAARLPPLTGRRPLFAPVLFPVGAAAADPAVYDEANIEVQEYDDGFAKIVHCHQPRSADAASEHQNQLVPATDAGIQVGWDDEQVTIWHNRQLDGARAPNPTGLPLGVLGYRVDVREKAGDPWVSLCSARAKIKFDPSIDGDFDFEPPIAPAPVRAFGGDTTPWLPRYFAQWIGKSLIVADDVPFRLTAGTKPLAPTIMASLVPLGLLRYGHTYHFRVRLVDLTHGGPSLREDAIHPAPATVGACTFHRFIHPRAVRSEVVRNAADPNNRIDQIFVWRPLLGYPEFLFAGVSDSVVGALIAKVGEAKANNIVLGANDPDVDTLRIIVEARTPAHDTTAPDELDGPFRIIYQLDTQFPVLPVDPVPAHPPDRAEAITLSLVYQDVQNIKDLPAPPAAVPPTPQLLPIPRARDVRIRLIPIAHNTNPDYFGDPSVQMGLTVNLSTRSDEGLENDLFDPAQLPVDQLHAIMLQPADDLPQRLAQHVGLDVNGLTFSGRPGSRVVFGASKALRHTLSGDHSAITFAAQNELLNHWIVAVRLDLDRDWTWDGLADRSVAVARDGQPVGTLEVRQTVSDAAVAAGAGDPNSQRDVTHLVFFDAVDPNPNPGKFPEAKTVTWRIEPALKPGLTTTDSPLSLAVTLPKAVRPTQTPKVASAGIALSPYTRSPDYSSTEPRRRVLWIEFEEAVADPADAYFARVLAYGPDPLLTGTLDTDDVAGPPLPIDPEYIRVITPGQTADPAGLDAMMQLSPSSDSLNPRHFILPLPPGITEEALELFGFWTYEFRVGHAGAGLARWSTAQARFGRPLRATGIQHPAPALKCLVARGPAEIQVVAPFATPIQNGRTLFSWGQPFTKMWMLFYAQITQADGATRRNVLLVTRQAAPIPDQLPDANLRPRASATRDVFGLAAVKEQEIQAILGELALPPDSSLSVLAVELLPGGTDNPRDPLVTDLGQQRILRTSPLTPIPAVC